ncbi:general transcription factor II-I repeat domain-containing protein 2B [Trichonephila inaurata madagascariensis]|uniref:General transcription factor II-I repeat domain-containing protein 2B n=1 Tax=Trichonephila inaurata madagascariensis TaxID=2747483 RepID=A0A8X6IEP8_9ARAC|nr:general transcription factor II-I repeat domain-containing protein 2B [Trichonephila inaurata madagascariensis]
MDNAQVTIFIHAVDTDFTIVEESVNVAALRDTDLCLSLTQTLDKCELDFNNITVITTHGAKSTTGEKTGATTLFKSDGKRNGNNTMTFLCIIQCHLSLRLK